MGTLSFEAFQLRRSEDSIRRSTLSAGLNPMALGFDPNRKDQHVQGGILPSGKRRSQHFYMVQENTSEARKERRDERRRSSLTRNERDSFRASVIRRFSGAATDETGPHG